MLLVIICPHGSVFLNQALFPESHTGCFIPPPQFISVYIENFCKCAINYAHNDDKIPIKPVITTIITTIIVAASPFDRGSCLGLVQLYFLLRVATQCTTTCTPLSAFGYV